MRHILVEFHQNQSTRGGVATADSLMSGPTNWWINFCFASTGVLFYAVKDVVNKKI